MGSNGHASSSKGLSLATLRGAKCCKGRIADDGGWALNQAGTRNLPFGPLSSDVIRIWDTPRQAIRGPFFNGPYQVSVVLWREISCSGRWGDRDLARIKRHTQLLRIHKQFAKGKFLFDLEVRRRVLSPEPQIRITPRHTHQLDSDGSPPPSSTITEVPYIRSSCYSGMTAENEPTAYSLSDMGSMWTLRGVQSYGRIWLNRPTNLERFLARLLGGDKMHQSGPCLATGSMPLGMVLSRVSEQGTRPGTPGLSSWSGSRPMHVHSFPRPARLQNSGGVLRFRDATWLPGPTPVGDVEAHRSGCDPHFGSCLLSFVFRPEAGVSTFADNTRRGQSRDGPPSGEK